jgi:hypothetical protein
MPALRRLPQTNVLRAESLPFELCRSIHQPTGGNTAMTTTTAATPSPSALRFGIDGHAARQLKDGERYYRIELRDGREALVAATTVTVSDGALVAKTDCETTIVRAPGTWSSVYMCEALMAYDPWSILHVPEPPK